MVPFLSNYNNNNTYLSAKYHAYDVAVDRDTRNRDKDRDEQLDRIENTLNKVLEELEFLSLEKRARQMVDSDSDLVGLPWATVEDIEIGINSVEKVEAVRRLLQSPAVSTSESRYIGDIYGVLFAKNSRGCFYAGLAQG